MKKILLIPIFVGISYLVFAILVQDFPGWDALREISPDIVIVRSTKTPPLVETNANGIKLDRDDGLYNAAMEVEFILKGETTFRRMKLKAPHLGPAQLLSQYRPVQGEVYAIYAFLNDDTYQAIETYRIVPLGYDFETNILTGKSLDEQIRLILNHRLGKLKQHMQEEQEEKARLEQAFK